jgi:hypothetical protein
MTKYNNGKIYKIEPVCEHDEGEIYIGSTTRTYLCERMTHHRYDYKKSKTDNNRKLSTSIIFDKYGLENCKILLLENFSCETRDELEAREGHYIRTLKCVNRIITGRTDKEYREDNKEKKKMIDKLYYEENKDVCKEKMRENYLKNKEKIIEQHKSLLQIIAPPNIEVNDKTAVNSLNTESTLYFQRYTPAITEIMDWVRVGLDGNLGEFKNLNLKELSLQAKKWHDSLEMGQAKINYEEKNPIIMDFRNKKGEGFYWVNLQTNNSPEECERMGHCGRTGSNNVLYSLREVKKLPNGKYTINKSHLTASIGKDGTFFL